MIRWETVTVRFCLHAQIEPIQVASPSTWNYPAVRLLVFDLLVVVPARVVLQKDFMNGKLLGKEATIMQKFRRVDGWKRSALSNLFQLQEVWPFLTIFIASYPRNVLRAVLNDLNPMPAFVSRFMARWSCSNTSFAVIQSFHSVSHRLANSKVAFGYAAFLSTVITRGVWVWVAFNTLRKKRSAAKPVPFRTSLWSPAYCPYCPPQGYKYFHTPFALIYVSSTRHESFVSCR